MSRRAAVAVIVALLAVVVVAAGRVAATDQDTGQGTLYGHVTRGPLTPVCRVGTPCRGPAKSVSLTFSHGAKRYTATTNRYGNYFLTLPAGSYTIATKAGMSWKPQQAVARRSRWTRVDISIDTGIR